jgi:hypothetical protein
VNINQGLDFANIILLTLENSGPRFMIFFKQPQLPVIAMARLASDVELMFTYAGSGKPAGARPNF